VERIVSRCWGHYFQGSGALVHPGAYLVTRGESLDHPRSVSHFDSVSHVIGRANGRNLSAINHIGSKEYYVILLTGL
jgi:hypothetical protein